MQNKRIFYIIQSALEMKNFRLFNYQFNHKVWSIFLESLLYFMEKVK